jgi:hypothetical protein
MEIEMVKEKSWVIVEKATGKAIFETFNEKVARVINTEKYRAVPIKEYLTSLNKGI